MFRVTFIREKKSIDVEAGTTVLEAQIQAGLTPDAPCGGAGTCGKCLVRIDGKSVQACQTKVESDIAVDTMAEKTKHEILTKGFCRSVPFAPGLEIHKIHMEKPLPGEKCSEWERLLEQLWVAGGPKPLAVKPDLVLAAGLYEKRKETPDWYVIHTDEEILELRQTPGRCCFAAFDIGTTTVAGYLLDAKSAEVLSVDSRMNPQAQYGADVIMRANYVMEHGGEALSSCIRATIREMLEHLAKKANVELTDIFQVSIAGNTCMHHLFLGISPASLVYAPYTPAIREGLTLRAAEYDIKIHPRGQLLMLPNIAGYVGADTCGCLLAVRPDLKEEVTLILDIGTNGEMVLGNKEHLAACSTAAGPALEGAKIECGMRGASGAVDHVSFENGEFHYHTIDDLPAQGICGSGLIDLVAALLRAGRIDEYGKLSTGQEQEHIFYLVPPEKSGNGKGVYLTQKDIREVQLAKAAIAAGMQLLMKRLSIAEKEIAEVYIAGAFGNYMDAESAGRIGLLPPGLIDRVKPIGNAAGEGAKIALISKEERRYADELVKRIDFVELAASPEFQDCFVDELGFVEEVSE
ncbi:MAG: ASKHA domain-containing protein [Eubacteriales bacterium]|nr:ASKHA domain-containing protein [Eubacteriales bacterium]